MHATSISNTICAHTVLLFSFLFLIFCASCCLNSKSRSEYAHMISCREREQANKKAVLHMQLQLQERVQTRAKEKEAQRHASFAQGLATHRKRTQCSGSGARHLLPLHSLCSPCCAQARDEEPAREGGAPIARPDAASSKTASGHRGDRRRAGRRGGETREEKEQKGKEGKAKRVKRAKS